MRQPTGTPPRAILIVGTSPWLERVTALGGSTDSDHSPPRETANWQVVAHVETQAAIAGDSHEYIDCVVTDDPTVVGAFDQPVIVGPAASHIEAATESRPTETTGGSSVEVTERPESAHLEAALEAGAVDVLDSTTVRHETLLARRLTAIARDCPERSDETTGPWYRALLENSPALFLLVDTDGRFTYVSPSVEHIGGYQSPELLDEEVLEYVHADDRERFQAALDAALDGECGYSVSCEYRFRHADGSWRVHEAELTNQIGGPLLEGILLSVQDITAYRLVERELNESFERVTDAFISLDTEGRITYLNDQAERLLDQPKRELLGKSLVQVFPALEESLFRQEALEATEKQEPRTIEHYYEPFDQYIEARMYPSDTGLSIYFRNVSERVRRERTLAERSEQLYTLVEHAPVVLFCLDADGVFTLSEGRALERVDLEPGEVVGHSIHEVFQEYPDVLRAAETALGGNDLHVYQEMKGRIFETWYRPIRSGEQVDRVIGIGVDVTERRQYDQTVNTLYETTQHLLSVESKQEACEYIVDVAADVLGLPNVVVYRFDDQANELTPAAHTPSMGSDIWTLPTFAPNSSITWDVFVTGNTRVHDDITTVDDVYTPTTVARSGLFVPLGEHGVLIALSREIGEYNEDTVELAQLFAATAEAALDRISRNQRLYEREQELKRRNQELERINTASSLREDIEDLLIRADSREEIEAGICSRLLEIDDCAYAWIGEPDPGGNQVLKRVDSGQGLGYLEAVTITAVDDDSAEPAGQAVRRSEPTYIPNVAQQLRRGAWRTEALSRDFQSAFSVPMTYENFLYGVLTVYSTNRSGFDGPIRSTLTELGETIAYAIDAVQRKQALIGNKTTEIELEIGTPTAISALAQAANAPVALEGVLTQDDGVTVLFVTVETSVTDETLEALETVSPPTVIRRDEEKTVLQLTVHGVFLAPIVERHGGVLRAVWSHPEEGTRATFSLPQSVAVRTVLSDINRRGIGATLVARREQAVEPDPGVGLTRHHNDAAILDSLTDRQREVVQTAYHAGFFDWPREATGEDLAGSLDISPPAFHRHVRTAERKLFTELFDRDGQPVDDG